MGPSLGLLKKEWVWGALEYAKVSSGGALEIELKTAMVAIVIHPPSRIWSINP